MFLYWKSYFASKNFEEIKFFFWRIPEIEHLVFRIGSSTKSASRMAPVGFFFFLFAWQHFSLWHFWPASSFPLAPFTRLYIFYVFYFIYFILCFFFILFSPCLWSFFHFFVRIPMRGATERGWKKKKQISNLMPRLIVWSY